MQRNINPKSTAQIKAEKAVIEAKKAVAAAKKANEKAEQIHKKSGFVERLRISREMANQTKK